MSDIDMTIADADKYAASADLRKAFVHYLDAISLIVAHVRAKTQFGPPEQGGPFKNVVVEQPADVERLFGLAHLCFTEAEDILNGTFSMEDRELLSDDDDAYPNSDSPAPSLGVGSRPPSRPPSDGAPSRPPSDDGSVRDFRDHRLSRPHSVRSTLRRMSKRQSWNPNVVEKVKMMDGNETGGETFTGSSSGSLRQPGNSNILDEGVRFPAVPRASPEIIAGDTPVAANGSWDASARQGRPSTYEDDMGVMMGQQQLEAEATPAGVDANNLPLPPVFASEGAQMYHEPEYAQPPQGSFPP
ncbi:hypothetical protein HK104_005706, partial [Borealophlyctis nickersoniae]